jgi:hypothetical protein
MSWKDDNHQFHPCLTTGREDEEVIEKILKHLGLWEMKARPPPKPKASLSNDALRLLRSSDLSTMLKTDFIR